MNYLQKIGVEVTWVKENNIEQYKQAVKSNTKVTAYTVAVPDLGKPRHCPGKILSIVVIAYRNSAVT